MVAGEVIRALRLLALGGLLLLAVRPASGAPAPAPPEQTARSSAPAAAGETLTIHLLTMGPGDHPFFKFGHTALWIHDARENTDRVYNYGTFNFDSLSLVPKFFLGRFLYSLSRSHLRSTLRSYRRENRSMVAQELELTAAQKVELRDFLEHNRLPENRYYRYDYYRDNCTTRVRDAIDRLVGGRLRDAAGGPASMTYRDHTLRLTADLLPEYVILLLVLGDLVDKPVDRWQETFLPEKLHSLAAEAKVPGPAGELPLVRREQVLLTAHRAAPLAEPPSWIPWFLLAGAAVGGGLAGLGYLGARHRVARVLHAVAVALLGFVAGFLGTFFCLLWGLTDHEVAYRNENILACAPWLLAMPVLAIGVGRGKPRSTRYALVAWTAAAGLALLGLLLKALPWFDQYNGPVIAFAVPMTLGAALGSRRLYRATLTRAAGVAAPAPPAEPAAPSAPEPAPAGAPRDP